MAQKKITECSGRKADIWSLGISLYVYMFLKLPFNGKNTEELINNI